LFCGERVERARGLRKALDDPVFRRDGINDHVVSAKTPFNPEGVGTKGRAPGTASGAAGGQAELRLRLTREQADDWGEAFAEVIARP